jgi:molybdopterin synthase sulfur carrier subunit
MSVTVRIPSPLRPVTGGLGELKVEGATVGDVLRKLDAQYAGFAERVFDDSGVRQFINVYVNEDNIRDKKNLETELKPGDTISILPSIAGGSFGDVDRIRASREFGQRHRNFPNYPKSSPRTLTTCS